MEFVAPRSIRSQSPPQRHRPKNTIFVPLLPATPTYDAGRVGVNGFGRVIKIVPAEYASFHMLTPIYDDVKSILRASIIDFEDLLVRLLVILHADAATQKLPQNSHKIWWDAGCYRIETYDEMIISDIVLYISSRRLKMPRHEYIRLMLRCWRCHHKKQHSFRVIYWHFLMRHIWELSIFRYIYFQSYNRAYISSLQYNYRGRRAILSAKIAHSWMITLSINERPIRRDTIYIQQRSLQRLSIEMLRHFELLL